MKVFLGNKWYEFMKFVDKIDVYVFDAVFHFFCAKTVWDKWNKINKTKDKN